jgi:2-keto-4-pentenoate hydratase
VPRELANLLWNQHRERVPFESLESRLAGLEEAYAVQDELVRLMEPAAGAPCGYKIGLTSARMRELCGLDQPVAGHVLAGRVHRSPARVAVREFVRLGVESEICVLLREELPLQGSAHSLERIGAAVGGIAAAFELVDDRGADYRKLDARSLVADNSWNAGVVLGEPIPAASTNVGALEGILRVGGAPVDSGNSRDALHPFEAVRWLCEHLARRGRHLCAGDFVMTGSIVATRFAAAGESYRFELAGLPSVELEVG